MLDAVDEAASQLRLRFDGANEIHSLAGVRDQQLKDAGKEAGVKGIKFMAAVKA